MKLNKRLLKVSFITITIASLSSCSSGVFRNREFNYEKNKVYQYNQTINYSNSQSKKQITPRLILPKGKDSYNSQKKSFEPYPPTILGNKKSKTLNKKT